MAPFHPTTNLLLIGGRSGVGKTSVAAEIFHFLAAADVRHAWIEGDFLDLAHPTPWEEGLDLAERNLRAVWGNYQSAGYHRLIYSNSASVLPGPSQSIRTAIGGDICLTTVLLTARDDTVASRLEQREHGDALEAHLLRSAEMAQLLDAKTPASVIRIPTDLLTVSDVALSIIHLLGWMK